MKRMNSGKKMIRMKPAFVTTRSFVSPPGPLAAVVGEHRSGDHQQRRDCDRGGDRKAAEHDFGFYRGMPSIQHVVIADGIVVLRLDRPERRNALNSELLAELVAWLERLAIDDAMRVLVFSTTSERARCARVSTSPEALDV